MSERPKVDRMVMFKHGVAYLERRGPAEGTFELSFRRDEMNDVLKSLAVWVARGDARVGAVAFEAPEDPEAALAERKLLFPQGEALGGLLHSLRGRTVEIDDGSEKRRGEVVGIDQSAGSDGAAIRRLVLRAGGGVIVFDLASLRSIALVEEPSRENLEFLVDRGKAATSGENRIVRVAVAGRADELHVAYVIPAPVWRVSYRLVREADSTLLMAMGIVFNPVDEDLSEIDLTLTTGQPVSFVIDLYHPKKVARAVVEESSRAAAAPTKFERSRAAPPPPGAGRPPMPASPAAFGPPPAPAQPAPQSMAMSFQASAEDAAVGADRGEFFEYRVATKISLKRGGSAMVPLIAARIDAKRERIWRDGSPPSPDLVLSFKNGSGAVLEEGPAVIYDEGVYAGESMVPYSPRNAPVLLAFAKDLAVRCRRTSTSHFEVAGLAVASAGMYETQRREERHTLSAESDHDEPVTVIFELPKRVDRTLLADGGAVLPFEETASFRRFSLEVAPHGKAEVLVREAWQEARIHRFENLTGQHLYQWLNQRFIDDRVYAELAGVLEAWEVARKLDEQRARVEREQQEAYAKQTKISEQLAVLKEGGPEGSLRLRYVKELEAEQDKVNRCEADIRRLRDEAEAARQRAGAKLAALTAGR